jgi:hypothetical protein
VPIAKQESKAKGAIAIQQERRSQWWWMRNEKHQLNSWIWRLIRGVRHVEAIHNHSSVNYQPKPTKDILYVTVQGGVGSGTLLEHTVICCCRFLLMFANF